MIARANGGSKADADLPPICLGVDLDSQSRKGTWPAPLDRKIGRRRLPEARGIRALQRTENRECVTTPPPLFGSDHARA